MSINGVLEDLALADVLQFIHLGRRTGTLYLWQDESRRAEIGFHDGRIVNAWTPGHRKLGDLLVEDGVIDRSSLDEALAFQKTQGKGQAIGKILLDRGTVRPQELSRVFREQVEATIFELVTWKNGRFHFEMDELHPVDDLGVAPGELLDNLDLNTQAVLLEAARLFDERQRSEQPPSEDRPLSVLDRRLKLAGFGRARDLEERPAGEKETRERDSPAAERLPAVESIRCQVVSEDEGLLQSLREGLPADQARVVSVRLREAGTRLPGASASPLVVLDLRQKGLGPDDLATLARTRPSASLVAVADDAEVAQAALRAGAVSAVTSADGLVVDCCRNLVRVLAQPQTLGLGFPSRGGFSRFRRVVFDVQSGLLSATMALNLMHVISESVERAVLFLVHGEALTAVGAFGFSHLDEPLARVTSGLKLRPEKGTTLRRVIEEAQPRTLSFAAADLPADFKALLGPPANGQAVIFPVLGAERPFSVIYTDNGTLDEEIQDIRILDLATSQVGVAFENELLRQKIETGGLDPVLD